ncbi:MAG: hypothetical protein QOG49_246, partial [Frankiaceae bacterium]|nr:hypothetical protein [Frankiaceae bacterium]
MTELYADAVRTLSRWRAPTDGQRALQADFVELLAARDDALRRSCVPAHITASTLVMDGAGEAVLLALHRKVGRWLQLGGHCE